MEEKNEEEYRFNLHNEEKHLKRNFPNYNIAYRNGGIDEIDELLKEKADIYTLIYSQNDAIFHATNTMKVEVMEPLLRDLINRLIKKINEYDEMIIVVATDHGSTMLDYRKMIILDIPDIIEIEQHGNCILLKSEFFHENTYKEIKGKFNNSIEWHIIWREDSYEYGLPDVINNKSVYAWLFPKNGYYYGRQAKGFTHGGLSMEETIIPYGIFRKQPVDFKDLVITLGDIYLFKNELSYIDIIIFNPNNYGIKKIYITLPTLGITKEIKDLSSNEKSKIRFEFLLKDSYCSDNRLKETVKFEISYINERKEQFFKIFEKVEEKVVSSINREISNKRTLDF